MTIRCAVCLQPYHLKNIWLVLCADFSVVETPSAELKQKRTFSATADIAYPATGSVTVYEEGLGVHCDAQTKMIQQIW